MRVALLLLPILLFTSCEVRFDWSWNKDKGSRDASVNDPTTTQSRPVAAFERVQFLGMGRLVFDSAVPAGQIVVSAPSSLLAQATVQVQDTQLRLGVEGWHGPGDWKLEFRVAPPRHLSLVHLSGVGSIQSEQLVTTSVPLEISLEGLGRIMLNVNAPEMTATQQGSGDLVVSGQSARVNVRAEGLGRVDVSQLTAKTVEVTSSGVGEVSVYASESLKVRGTGMGAVHFRGHPAQTDVQTEGLTQVKAID